MIIATGLVQYILHFIRQTVNTTRFFLGFYIWENILWHVNVCALLTSLFQLLEKINTHTHTHTNIHSPCWDWFTFVSQARRYHGPLRQACYDSSGKVGRRWQQAHDGKELLITNGEINHSYTERKRGRGETCFGLFSTVGKQFHLLWDLFYVF